MADSTDQEVIVLEPSADEASENEFKIVSEIPETENVEQSESGEVVKNISEDDSPESLLLQKMEELKTADEEVVKIPTLQEMFTAIVKLNFETGSASHQFLPAWEFYGYFPTVSYYI